ncbi:hypothetical protein KR51_00017960 [Rubidibacter lacunae KORDI 51-2]|uniref:DUF2062 domain-containing protein n=2 Tax=Rubidibacter TaxID=582491 RepID=U5DL10_9CHRO|nr:hypothetical protein KR51_00017960 [Rubidibacter lacunae KORDI 51-2]
MLEGIEPIFAPAMQRSQPTPSRVPRSWRVRWHRRLRYLYLRVIRLQSSTPAIARGMAIGVFAGWFPFFGLQTILSVVLAALVRGNKLVAAAATWVSNPLTYVPIYAFNFQVGCWLLGWNGRSLAEVNWRSWSEMSAMGSAFVTRILSGSFVAGVFAAIAAYLLSLWLIPRVRASVGSVRNRV